MRLKVDFEGEKMKDKFVIIPLPVFYYDHSDKHFVIGLAWLVFQGAMLIGKR